MRRQIGAVVPFNKLDRPMTGGWMAEFVVPIESLCVSGPKWTHSMLSAA